MGILVTGGAGFVGLNIAEQLLARGDDVVIFGPTPPPAVAVTVLRKNPGRLTIVPGDVSVAADLDAAIERNAIDRIVHGAAITADLARERRAARDIFTVNLMGTIELLETALRHPVRRVLQVGTGSIFGAAGKLSDVLDEQTSPLLPTSLYGISKFAAERTGVRYRDTRHLNLTVARLGMVFGRWEYDTGVRDTLSLARQLLPIAQAGGAVVLHNGFADDWVYSVDVARGVIALLDLPSSPEPIYHVSAGMRWSLDDWCQRLKQRYPAFEYRLTDGLEDCTVGRNKTPRRSLMSIERLRRDTGYEPAYLAEKAFDDYIAWDTATGDFG